MHGGTKEKEVLAHGRTSSEETNTYFRGGDFTHVNPTLVTSSLAAWKLAAIGSYNAKLCTSA